MTRTTLISFGSGLVVGFFAAVLMCVALLPVPKRSSGILPIEPGGSFYSQNVTNTARLVVPASTHGYGATMNLMAFCFDSETPEREVICSYEVSPDGTVQFDWNPPFTGKVVIAPRQRR